VKIHTKDVRYVQFQVFQAVLRVLLALSGSIQLFQRHQDVIGTWQTLDQIQKSLVRVVI